MPELSMRVSPSVFTVRTREHTTDVPMPITPPLVMSEHHAAATSIKYHNVKPARALQRHVTV
jgi:hypothetical protein